MLYVLLFHLSVFKWYFVLFLGLSPNYSYSFVNDYLASLLITFFGLGAALQHHRVELHAVWDPN